MDRTSNTKRTNKPIKKEVPKTTRSLSFLGCVSFPLFCFRFFNAACSLAGVCSFVRKLIIVWFIVVDLDGAGITGQRKNK